jgi:hypothetical protein
MEHILDLKDHEEFIKDNRWRSKAAVVVLLVSILISLVNLFIYWLQYDMLESSDGTLFPEQLASNRLRLQIITPFELAISITYWIFFIMWFRRAYCNLYRIGVPHLDSPEGLAAGAWFIPIYNLFKPFAMMREICDNTTYYVQKAAPSFLSPLPQKVIGWWWAVYVSSFLASLSVVAFRPHSLKLSRQLLSTEYSMGLKLFEIASAILLIVVIRRLLPFEEEMKNRQVEIHAGFDVFGNVKGAQSK